MNTRTTRLDQYKIGNVRTIFSPASVYIAIAITLSCLLWLGCEQKPQGTSDINSDEPKAAANSLTGEALFPLEESEKSTLKKDSLLSIAKDNFDAEKSLDNIIWYGRRLAYLYKYEEAITVYSDGLELFPESPELYRHRGHRYLSIRKFTQASQDYEKAAELAMGRDIEIEPDGQPNRLNIPLSNLHFNIYYHWALAHYLMGDFENAAEKWSICMDYSVNDDLKIATSDWYYMTLRRLGQKEKADALLTDITADMEIIENTSYLKRLLMYKGEIAPSELLDLENAAEDAQLDIVTQGYGVGNYYLYNGDKDRAFAIFERIVACDYWPAFGYIAAEAEIFRNQ